MNIDLHKYQMRALKSLKRIILLVAGIQGGKTFFGAIWMLLQVSLPKNKVANANFLVIAPTYKIMNQATLPEFMKRFDGYGKLVKSSGSPDYFLMSQNRRIYLRSMVDPDSLEGIPNTRAIWTDEAGKINEKAWININGRAAPKEAPILLTTTPYSLGWLYRQVYKPWQAGKRSDVEVIEFASVDNPHFPPAEYKRQKSLLDPRVFAMKYEGKFKKMAGLVFLDFNETLNTEAPFNVKGSDYRVFAGVDWGFTNPFAISVRAMHKTEPRDYQIAEFYQSYLTPDEQIVIAKQLKQQYGIEMFFCDNEDPGMIESFNRAGLTATAVKKYNGSLRDYIADFNEIIKNRTFKMFKGKCGHTIDEMETYHYPEDAGDDKNTQENPVDSNNHLMGANMYATQGMKTYKRIAIVKPVYTKSRLQRLMAGEMATVNVNEDWYQNDGNKVI